MNYNDVTVVLDGILKKLEEDKGVPKFKGFPDVRIPAMDTSFLSGISLAAEKYTRKLSYEEDIFSELPVKLFDFTYNKQMADFLASFRRKYYDKTNQEPNKKIPKFVYSNNSEEQSELIRMVYEWSQGNAMLYFSFENKPEESNFGMIWNDNKGKNYMTRSGNLFLNPADEVIHEVIDFMFRVF